MSKYCVSCGAELVDNAKFCSKCGANAETDVPVINEQLNNEKVNHKQRTTFKEMWEKSSTGKRLGIVTACIIALFLVVKYWVFFISLAAVIGVLLLIFMIVTPKSGKVKHAGTIGIYLTAKIVAVILVVLCVVGFISNSISVTVDTANSSVSSSGSSTSNTTESKISIVRDAYWEMYCKTVTIGEAFDAYFSDGVWAYASSDEYEFVMYETTYDNLTMDIIFILKSYYKDDDGFQLYTITVGDLELYNQTGLILDIFSKYQYY